MTKAKVIRITGQADTPDGGHVNAFGGQAQSEQDRLLEEEMRKLGQVGYQNYLSDGTTTRRRPTPSNDRYSF